MPEFKPGEKTTARATLTNLTAKQWTYEVELYLGVTKEATSGVGSITIAAGASQVVDLPVTMPSVEGTYPVYLDVFVAGELLEHHRVAANGVPDDVVIVSVPVSLAPCVYCGATFTSEAALVGHMEGNHPRKPYVVYAYPEGAVPSGGSIGINYKVYTPAVPAGDRTYGFTFYIPGYQVWEPYNGAYVSLRGGTPEGFYEGVAGWRAEYMTGRYQFTDIPPGTYQLYSKCRHLADVGEYAWGTIETFWKDVDTGQTITVV